MPLSVKGIRKEKPSGSPDGFPFLMRGEIVMSYQLSVLYYNVQMCSKYVLSLIHIYTSPVLAPFIYGTLERLLLPFGLHHMLTIPMNYTSFGGTYTILTGANAGTQVFP